MVFVVLAIGAYVWINTKPPVHAGEVLNVNVYPIHRELSTGPAKGADEKGIAAQGDTFDEVIVLVDARIKNQTDIPLFLHDMWAVVDLPNDEQQRSLASSQTEFANVFIAYPTLKPLKKEPLLRDITLQPGQQVKVIPEFFHRSIGSLVVCPHRSAH